MTLTPNCWPIDAATLYSAVVNASTDAIITKTLGGIVTSWNPAAGQIFGYSADEMIGQPIDRLIPDDRKTEEAGILDRIGAGHIVPYFETRRICKDGRCIPIGVTISPIPDANGTIIGASKIARDISPRKAAEQQAMLLMAAAEAASQAKSRFLSVMSHELRTPLNGIMGSLQIIELSPISASVRDNVVQGLTSARSLLHLLEEILDYASSEKATAQPITPFRLGRLLNSVVRETLPRDTSIDLRLDIDATLQTGTLAGDVRHIKLALGKLLENAFKFTPAGSITLAVQQAGGSAATPLVEFAVSDTGIGMSAEETGRLFQPFTQVDMRMERRYGGAGLGLALCQRLVSLMGGGPLSVTSEPGQGSRFAFRLALPYTPDTGMAR